MTFHHQYVFPQNPKSHISFSPIEGSTSMAGFQPPSPISNSLPLPPPTPHYFTLAPPPPWTPTPNT